MTPPTPKDEPGWLPILLDMGRNPFYADQQIVPIINDGTWKAVADYVAELRAERDALKRALRKEIDRNDVFFAERDEARAERDAAVQERDETVAGAEYRRKLLAALEARCATAEAERDAAVQREQNVRDRARRAAQILVEEIGACGAVNVEQLAKCACDVIHELRTRLAAVERDAKRWQYVRDNALVVTTLTNSDGKVVEYVRVGFDAATENTDALLDAALTPTRHAAGGDTV